MKLQMFAVFDAAAEVYGRPFFSPSVGLAVRSFGDEVNRGDRDSALCTHPSDFSLYHLGSYEDGFAQFEIFKQPERVVLANSLIQVKGDSDVSK